MGRTRRITGALCAVLVLAGAVGCSDDESDAGETGLLRGLALVKSTKETRQQFSYGNLAAIAELMAVDKDRFLRLVGPGLDLLYTNTVLIKDGIGLDLLAMRDAVTAGAPPSYVGLVRGKYDVDAVNERIATRKVDSTEDGDATTWTAGANGEVDLKNGPFVGVVRLNEFNNIRTAPGSFSYAPRADALAWATDPGEQTLAQEADLRSAAGCLGEVVIAMMIRNPKDPETVYAVGVRAPSAENLTEVICVLPGAGEAAGLRDGIAASLKDGSNPRTDPLRNAAVEVAGDAVRVTHKVPDDDPPGAALRLLIDGSLYTLGR